uniref:Pelargonidin 3-O-(6-caffeoylglucoside) 5-O-(6-O-malonylglucoside) 4'''-malonyltransferase-like n=1 Tax=Tanacetum cinerariifolium TaxID=118510 RepID=A0A699IF84_TANCI|nr:pelargonidin 3-O-(6-caffeoylglucoside) 5-O-(6-O-malonylglucoside) 4'''-malonyltransferase-like [Tanacetum cinerariifolium]
MEIPKVEIRSKKLIKPSIPTPTTLHHHKMGFKDEVVAAINVRLILFYSIVGDGQNSTSKLPNWKTLQATVFDCGGLALGVSVSHKVADAATLCIFLNDWAALTREDIIIDSVCPSFNSSVFLPPRGFMDYDRPLPRTLKRRFEKNYKNKRFSFSEKAISLIRAKTNSGRIYSRVQLVSAMIWKALIDVDQEKLGHARALVLHQPVNLRGKTAPPIPNDACGNLGGFIITQCSIAQKSMGFACLLDLLHDSIKKTVDDLGKLSSKSEEFQTFVFNSFVKSETCGELVSVFPFISWCKFPFYEVDFGLRRPVWIASSAGPASMVTLVDGQGGFGVDAYVNLEVEDMLNVCLTFLCLWSSEKNTEVILSCVTRVDYIISRTSYYVRELVCLKSS